MHPIVAGLLFATLDPNAAISTANPSVAPTTTLTLNIAGVPNVAPSLGVGPNFGARQLVAGNGLAAIAQRAGARRSNTASSSSSSSSAQSTTTTPAPADNATPAAAEAEQAAPADAAPADAATPAGPEPAAAEPAGPAGPAGPEGGDGSSDEPSVDLINHRQQMVSLHRPLGIATFATLTVTEVLGLFAAINQRTLIGPGECRAGGNPILGAEFGCNGLSALHGVFSFATVTLYATTGIYALSMPDPERAAEGSSRGATRLRIHKALAWVHAIGMVAMPVLGFIAANPNAFGIQDVRGDYAAGFRTAHEFLGFVTWGALGAAMVVELVP